MTTLPRRSTPPRAASTILLAALLVGGSPLGMSTVVAVAAPPATKIIDTHIHLYDTTRKAGVPWPPKSDTVLYKPHLPAEMKKVSKPAGVTGAVIVEASDRLEDNGWVLDLVKGDDFYVALVGNVDPYREDFGKQIDVLRKDRRLVGVRARVQGKQIDYRNERVRQSFRELAERGLTLDVLMNGDGADTVLEIDRVARAIPKLRIVVNHVLGYNIDGKQPPREWVDAVAKLAKNENVWCKVSGLYQRSVQQPAPKSVDYYRSVLDVLWKEFGRDRLVYGSNWPVTKKSGDYASYVDVVGKYFGEKGREASERYFWKNAVEAYRLELPAADSE